MFQKTPLKRERLSNGKEYPPNNAPNHDLIFGPSRLLLNIPCKISSRTGKQLITSNEKDWDEPWSKNPAFYFPLQYWLFNDGSLMSWFMK